MAEKLTGIDLVLETLGEWLFLGGMICVGFKIADTTGICTAGIIAAVLIVARRKFRSRTSHPIEDDTAKE